MKKRPTPMKVKKEGMEAYAAKRGKALAQPKLRPVPINGARAMMMHDPEGDLHHLMRAAEVKADKRRHQAALKVGQERVRAMQRVMAGPKDEA